MNTKYGIFLIVLFVTVAFAIACGEKDQIKSDGPLKTARELLRLHDLLGVQPDERSQEIRKKEVDPKALRQLIADYDSEDKFLRDLYVGFVVGALARNQDKLDVSDDKLRARILAGNLKIRLVFVDNRWKILLKETIPEEVKKRALEEKKNLESKI